MRAKGKRRRYIPLLAVGLSVLVVAGGAFALVRKFLNSTPSPPKQLVQQIQLIRPPPPPPDLPPPPPPPPEEKVDVPEPPQQPDQTPSEPPPGDQLGLDAAGTAGGDAFGLAARPGGRDLVGSGGSAYVWYTGTLKNDIMSLLQNDPAVQKGSYSVSVRLWLKTDGTIERFSLLGSTGDRSRDKALEKKLATLSRSSQTPPAGMPEIVTLEIVTRS